MPLTPPSWYSGLDSFLQREGWPVLLLASFIIIGVTLWLIMTKRAAALALWLTYLYAP